jgi:flagellar protein FlgJ
MNSISASRPVQLPFAAQATRLPNNGQVTANEVKNLQGKVADAESKSDQNGPDDIRKVAESFEAIILRQLLASMRKAKLGEDMFGSSATDNFREMADARTADAMSHMGQFGIADMVERQLRGIEAAKQLGGAK